MKKFIELILLILQLFSGKKKSRNAIIKERDKKKKQIDQAVSKEETDDINRITADVVSQHDDNGLQDKT